MTIFDIQILGDTESTAHRGDHGKAAYEHAQSSHAPADAQKNSNILKSEIEAVFTGTITTHTHSSISGNAATATKLATARSIALSGDVTGSANFDGSANITITATVADDSHNHVISNVDGLQTALDAKLATASYTAADVLTKLKTVDGSGSGLDADLLDGLSSASFLRSDVTNSVVRTDKYVNSTGRVLTYDFSVNPNAGIGDLDLYFDTGEVVELFSFVPTGNSQNYYVEGTVKIQMGQSVETLFIRAAIRSDILPQLSWSGQYERYSEANYSTCIPRFWVNEVVGGELRLILDFVNSNIHDIEASFKVFQRADYGEALTVLANHTTDTLPTNFIEYDLHKVWEVTNTGLTTTDSINTGDLTITKDMPWLTLRSSGSGSLTVEQAGGLSIGEGANASLHLTYTGDGKAHIGMGTVTDAVPLQEAMQLSYLSNAVKFLATPNVNGSDVWHAGNDGAGSGLDADLLDGYHADATVTGDTIALRNANGDLSARYMTTVYTSMGHSAVYRATDTVFFSTYDNYIRKNTLAGFKASLALENVDNTSDADKPVSSATQTALNGKLDSAIDNDNAACNIRSSGLYMEIGKTSGSVCMNVNDGYGNANLTFNHTAGKPDKTGNAGRIVVNVDDTTNPLMTFSLGENLTAGVATALTNALVLGPSAAAFTGSITCSTPAVGDNTTKVATTAFVNTSFFRSNASNAVDVRLASGNGRGLRFWDSDQYKIFMSAAGDATYGGRISGDTTSDYNIYFRIGPAANNRGFVFENTKAEKLFAINPDGVRSTVAITCPTPTAGDNSTKVATTAYVDNAVAGADPGTSPGKAIALAMIFG